MATYFGSNGIVKLSTDTVLEVINWNLTANAAIIEDSVQGDSSKTHKVGRKDWSGSISCYWDKGDSTGQEVMVEGASVDLHLLPDGEAAGDIDFNGTASVATVERVSADESIVTANFTFTGNGDLTRSVLV